MQDTAAVACPHCGEAMIIQVDLSGGRKQLFVEDCPVCCRASEVSVAFDARGNATVTTIPG